MLDKKKEENVKIDMNCQEKKVTEFRCTTCKGAVFKEKDIFREHYKSNWHRENVKRKTKNLECID